MSRKIITLLAALLLLTLQLTAVCAADISDVEKELERVEREIEELKQQLQQNNSQKQNTLSEIAYLDVQLEQTQNQIAALEKSISETENEIEETEARLVEAERELVEKDERMRRRVRAIYKYGVVSYIAVLFQAESFSDLISRYEMMKRMVNQDVELIDEVKQLKAQIEDDKARLEQQRQSLTAQKRQLTYSRQLLASRKKQRQLQLAQLQKDREEYERALKAQEELSKRLEEIIRSYQAGKVAGSGKFRWPTPGYRWITSYFGYRTHPIHGTRSFHTGIDIGIPYGRNIVAADHGTVTHAGSLGGYGKTVIIDHGNGFATLYAHNSAILVKAGDVVTKGQVISKCGSTGWSTGPHLHFEIRKNGTPVNPLDYVKPQ